MKFIFKITLALSVTLLSTVCLCNGLSQQTFNDMTIHEQYQDYLSNPNLKPYGLIKDDHRTCTKCNQTKPYTEFKFSKGKVYYMMSSSCRECHREKDRKRTRAFTREQKDRANEQHKKYRQTYKYKVAYTRNTSDVYFIKCFICETIITKRTKPKTKKCFCSDECVTHYKARCEKNRQVIAIPNSKANCNTCGNVFIAATGRNKNCMFCIEKKKRCDQWIGKIKWKYPNYKGKLDRIDKLDVIRRDKGMCNLCGIPTQKESPYAPNACEIDHIIPLSREGDHTMNNVWVLCRSCNQHKSNNIVYPGGVPHFEVH